MKMTGHDRSREPSIDPKDRLHRDQRCPRPRGAHQLLERRQGLPEESPPLVVHFTVEVPLELGEPGLEAGLLAPCPDGIPAHPGARARASPPGRSPEARLGEGWRPAVASVREASSAASREP